MTIDHNTIVHSGFVVASAGEPNPGFAFTNNVTKHNQWGIYGNGHGAGFDSTNIYFTSDFDMRRNVHGRRRRLEVSGRQLLPGHRRLPGAVREPLDRRLPAGATSPFKSAATDNTRLGVDVAQARPQYQRRARH